MSSFKIALLSTGLVAVAASSAMADGFRYAGSPKFGQFYVREKSSVANPLLDARAQLVEVPRSMPKGGIAARGP
jgi:hypothetical protein